MHTRLNLIPIMCLLVTTGGFSSIDASADDTPMLHPLEQYCVEFEMAGLMAGDWTECSRDYGYERYELQNTVISFGGISQTDSKRVVYIGPNIYTIPENGPATVVTNTMFDQTAAMLEDGDPMEQSSSLLSSLGFTPTGATMEIVGLTCNVATGQMGTMCMTDDGLTLYFETMGQTRTAVSVDLESGGDDANYAIPDDVQQAPSMDDLQNLFQGLGGPPQNRR